MKELALVAFTVGLIALVVSLPPDPKLTYVAGVRPDADRSDGVVCDLKVVCAPTAPGLNGYRWHLPADRGYIFTTWTTNRPDVPAVIGELRHEYTNCPGSQIAWELTVDGHTGSGTLTASDPTVRLDIPVDEPLDRVTLLMHRLDAADCASSLFWAAPHLRLPEPLLLD